MLKLQGITKAFEGVSVLENISFTFAESAVTAITGPSGCGKTTLLNIMLGLLLPDSGEIYMQDGMRVSAVFQEDRLIEHFSAAQNLRLTSPQSVTDAEITEALQSLGLPPHDTKRVAKYSGGMRRRVAIARAVLYAPELLLMDEPFKGLDEAARVATAEFVLQRLPNAAIVLVTHEREELAIMRVGATLQLGNDSTK